VTTGSTLAEDPGPVGAVPAAAPRARSPGLWALAWRRLRRDRVAMACLAVVAIFLTVMAASAAGLVASGWDREVGVSYANPAFLSGAENLEAARSAGVDEPGAGPPVDISDIDPLAPYYAQWDARAAQVQAIVAEPREALPFGGDKWGRDVLQKTIKGSEVSITVGIVAALVATALGTLLGALAGYWGGRTNDVLEWFYNVFTSIPYILLILAFAAVLGQGLVTIILILGLTGWTGIYRLVRAEYIKHSSREYVRAAEAIGTSNAGRMFVHILPNTSHVVLVQFSQHVVSFIKAEVILSFLGLGVPVSMVSWGTMLAEAQEELVIGKWWQLAAAGLSMAVLVTAISLLTDAMRDALDPKLRVKS
jgi:oligopeptide transport system permease protein